MAAPKYNEFYKLRKTHGRPRLYTPEELLEQANKYFKYCINTPLQETIVQKIRIARDKEKIVKVQVPKMRAMTIKGLCLFLEIDLHTWLEYEKAEGYSHICTCVRDMIYTFKLEGAAGGLLNASIIARELGLIDKTDITSDGARFNTAPEIKIMLEGKDINLK